MLKSFTYIARDDKRLFNVHGMARAVMMAIRGAVASVKLRRLVLLAHGARIQHARYLHGSGLIKAEEQVTIQGISLLGVTLGNAVSFGAFSQLRPSSQYGGLLGEGCRIGDGTTFGPFTYIGCAGFIEIGSNCMFGPRISLIAENHVIPSAGEALKGSGVTRLGIKIGNDCWIGANSIILDGANIGNGAIIGAGSVVRGSIPSNAIAVGAPARIVRLR